MFDVEFLVALASFLRPSRARKANDQAHSLPPGDILHNPAANFKYIIIQDFLVLLPPPERGKNGKFFVLLFSFGEYNCYRGQRAVMMECGLRIQFANAPARTSLITRGISASPVFMATSTKSPCGVLAATASTSCVKRLVATRLLP